VTTRWVGYMARSRPKIRSTVYLWNLLPSLDHSDSDYFSFYLLNGGRSSIYIDEGGNQEVFRLCSFSKSIPFGGFYLVGQTNLGLLTVGQEPLLQQRMDSIDLPVVLTIGWCFPFYIKSKTGKHFLYGLNTPNRSRKKWSMGYRGTISLVNGIWRIR
jgi:hypothetical protein